MLLRVEAADKLCRKEHERKNLNLNSGARAAAPSARVMSRMPRRARRKGEITACSKQRSFSEEHDSQFSRGLTNIDTLNSGYGEMEIAYDVNIVYCKTATLGGI